MESKRGDEVAASHQASHLQVRDLTLTPSTEVRSTRAEYGLKLSVAAPMTEQQHRARTDEERHYYALNAKAWRILAPFYDAIVFPLKRLRRDVAKLAGVGPASRVLDVATGTGAQALAFAETGADVVGIDLSESMLRIARRKARDRKATFRVADARELPFEDARFDVCCVSFGLHEMPVSVRQQALLEMARVTKPSGKIVIVDYALPKNPIASKLVYHLVKLYERDHYAEFVRSDLHAMLARAGLAARAEARVAPGAMRWWSPATIVIASKIERVVLGADEVALPIRIASGEERTTPSDARAETFLEKVRARLRELGVPER